jgi:hypothetical protein
MAEVVGFKLVLDGKEQVVSSIGEMKKLLKEANFELVKAQQNFGEYSQEAVNAAKKVATLKDTIQEAKETSDLFDPGKKFQAFAGAISAVAGGFSAVQGALGLVGVESENVEKTLLKVQSALALSQGLSTIADAAKDFQRLNAIIQQTTIFQRANNIATATAVAVQRAFGVATVQTSVAFRVLKTAIAATGIGLLVVGLTALIGKIQDWTSASDKAAEAQKKLAKDTDFLNAQINNEIAILTSVGNKEDEIYRKRVQIANNELNVLRSAAKQKGELTQEEIKKFGELKTQLVTLEIDEKNRIKKVNEDAQKEKDKKDKEAADKAKAVAQERIQGNKDADEQIRSQTQENFLLAIKDEDERAKKKIDFDLQNKILEINALNADESKKKQLRLQAVKSAALEIANLEEQIKQEKKEKEEEDTKERQEKEKKNEEDRAARIRQQYEYDKKTREEFQQAELEATKFLQDQKVALVDAGINLISALAGKNEKVANVFYAIQKAVEIGRIITTTTGAIAKIKADTAAIPAFIGPGIPNPAFIAATLASTKKILGLKIGAASSIASIAASSISKFKGSAGGSVGGTQETGSIGIGSAPLSPNAPIQNTLTQLDQATINRLGSASNRAYVLESDVTNSQERITRINRAARLG